MAQKNKKPIIIPWLAHHNPKRGDFNDHVLYISNYAICIGCFSFLLGALVALILSNLFYSSIIRLISAPLGFLIFLVCWIPSIFQYSIQIARKKPLKNRSIKFFFRFLYPFGSIIFIFVFPLLGLLITIPAGYSIVIIRKAKNKKLRQLTN